METGRNIEESSCALVVDLDGTLIRSDLLFESLFVTARRSPLRAVRAGWWLLRYGRAYLKHRLAEEGIGDPALLPYRSEVISLIERARAEGRPVMLSSASNHKLVQQVADYLGLFDKVQGSSATRNLKGSEKARAIQEVYPCYDYIGDSRADLDVWKGSRKAYIAGGGAALVRDLRARHSLVECLPPASKRTAPLLRALRPHQWVKNALLFLPIFLAHRGGDLSALVAVVTAVASFCACASAVYVSNDLFDLEADRQHRKKRLRPFASGELSLSLGILLVPMLVLTSALLASSLPLPFIALLGGYVLLTVLYTLYLKQIVLVDILVLAGLYTLRILAGGEAVNIRVSPWLLAFSTFFFLSLACLKRFSELRDYISAGHGGTGKLSRRGYRPSDIEQVSQFGSSSGYISVLVLALYINSADVIALYSHPTILWLICPLMLYWISRMWLIAHRGEMHHDPVLYALRDTVSYVVGGATVALLMIAI